MTKPVVSEHINAVWVERKVLAALDRIEGKVDTNACGSASARARARSVAAARRGATGRDRTGRG